jgi:hypothetical protein
MRRECALFAGNTPSHDAAASRVPVENPSVKAFAAGWRNLTNRGAFDRRGLLDRLRMNAAFGGTGEQPIRHQREQRTDFRPARNVTAATRHRGFAKAPAMGPPTAIKRFREMWASQLTVIHRR